MNHPQTLSKAQMLLAQKHRAQVVQIIADCAPPPLA